MADERHGRAGRPAAPFVLAMMVLLVVVILRFVTPVMAVAVGSSRLPQWDMAKYGVSGLRLARALQNLDLGNFICHVNALDVWPPVFPLLEVPAFMLAGPGYASARALVALLFAAAIGVAFWSGLNSRRQLGFAVGALAAALVASSPMVQVFATVVMLEVPGTLLLLLSVGFYLRSLGTGRVRGFSIACVAATTLFFCKYNYGLIWIAAMTAGELLRACRPAEARLQTALNCLVRNMKRPRWIMVAIALLVAAGIELAGPWRFTIAGRAVSVSSAGLWLYSLYALVLLSWLLRPRRSIEAGRRWLGRLDPRARTMVLAIGLPIGLWMAVPSHTINFVLFLVNRSVGPPIWSLESLLFYPQVFVTELSATPAIGVAVLFFGILSLRRLRGNDERGRVLALALLLSSISVVAHPYKHPRFFFTSATLLWLAASREAVELVARASSRAGGNVRSFIAGSMAGASLVAVAVVGADVDHLRRGHRRRTVETSTAEVLDAIADEAAKADTSVLLGTWNHLSPWLVEWRCRQRRPPMEPARIPRSPTGRVRRGDVLGWLAAASPERVMLLSAAMDSDPRAGFVSETRWLDPIRRELIDDPRFLLVSQRDFPGARYRLQSFRPTRTEGEPVPR